MLFRSGAWTLSRVFDDPSPANLASFGTSARISGDASTIAIGSPGDAQVHIFINNVTPNPSPTPMSGYAAQNSSWGLEKTYQGVSGNFFGKGVSISDDGKILVIGNSGINVSGNTGAGQAEIYLKTAGVWGSTSAQTLSSSDNGGTAVSINANYGGYNDISSDGSVIVAGNSNSGTLVNVYHKSGSTWTRDGALKDRKSTRLNSSH